MREPAKQFDPGAQFEALMNEIEAELIDTQSKLARLAWLREKIAAEHAALAAAVDTLDVYTEEEAAALLKTDARMLADMRRRFNLPFFRVGREVRYTGEHLREATALLEVNKKPRKALQASPLKRAA